MRILRGLLPPRSIRIRFSEHKRPMPASASRGQRSPLSSSTPCGTGFAYELMRTGPVLPERELCFSCAAVILSSVMVRIHYKSSSPFLRNLSARCVPGLHRPASAGLLYIVVYSIFCQGARKIRPRRAFPRGNAAGAFRRPRSARRSPLSGKYPCNRPSRRGRSHRSPACRAALPEPGRR